LTTTRSNAGALEDLDVVFASARAWSMLPACSASAPQHPCAAGASTVQPFGGQHVDGGPVHGGEGEALDASGEHPPP